MLKVSGGMSVLFAAGDPVLHPAGDLMVRGGIAERLVNLASARWLLRGGLAQVNIVTSTLFGGISGSAVAEAAAVGGLMIPQMKAPAMPRLFAVNVTISRRR